MPDPLRILMLEDSDSDAELIQRALVRGGIVFELTRVQSEKPFRETLDSFAPDIVLADYALPSFDGISALRIVRERDDCVPFILLSGTLGDERAVEALRLGATDYVLKDRLGRLPSAVERARQEAMATIAKRRADEALRDRAELESVIRRFATEFINVSAADVDRCLDEALRRIGEFAGVDRSSVFLFSRDGATIDKTNEWTNEGIAPQKARIRNVPRLAFGWSMSILEEGRPLHIGDVSALPPEAHAERALLEQQGIVSLVFVPMRAKSSLIGFVGFDMVRKQRAWSPDTIALLEMIGTIFANAIERVRAEAELRQEQEFVSRVIDTAPTLIVVLDRDGRVLRVNQAFERATGYAANDVIGRHIIDAELSDRVSGAVGVLLRQITGDGSTSRSESTLVTRDGSRRHIVWHATTIRTAAGEAEHVVAIGVDETGTRLLESQLEQSRRIESLGRVAATVAHEFNNVLMSIGPFAELIRRGKADPDAVRTAAERISASVQRGQRVTEEVMRFTRRAEPTLRPVAVDDWLRTFTADMSVVLQERTSGKVAIELDSVEPLPRVSVDPAQLYQVLNNLVTNAADAMPTGGVVKIVARGGGHGAEPAPFDARGFVHLSVSDCGGGIPPETLSRIFEPFFTTKRSGTGIGLAAAHQMITAFGGHIFAESEVGRGTTFHLYLRHAD
ncbi:MAG: hypothetical protein JWO97_1205 [Acidobacteria bacterium]|nr:hypothetical protein [Acidobacteriota bacterium]